jgi:hypothetical protein
MKTFPRSLWSRVLIVLGSIGMVVGAIDPMEGSIFILLGSLILALGTFFNQSERHLLAYRAWVFILIAVGVGAMWVLSTAGGIGGKSGHSMWWGVLILPYLIGWSMGIWGPGSPRWLLVVGIGVGLWYLAILGLILKHSWERDGAMSTLPAFIIAAIGVLTIGGCIRRWRRDSPHLVPSTLRSADTEDGRA